MNLSEVLFEKLLEACTVCWCYTPRNLLASCGALLTGQQIWLRSMTFP